jgi:malate dehydrogenase (oxaloacetate-decarboxylating)(NADP+)
VSKNLTGLIPHAMETVDTQVARCMKMINSRQTNIDKYLYLSSLKDQNVDLFYRVLIDNVRELMPLVYTPTIGDVCLQYSTLYTRPEALYISIKQRKSIRTILRNWPYPNPEICVVTDGSRILGLGDLGVNGVGISVSLYSWPASGPVNGALTIACLDREASPLHWRCGYPPGEDPAHRPGLRHRK